MRGLLIRFKAVWSVLTSKSAVIYSLNQKSYGAHASLLTIQAGSMERCTASMIIRENAEQFLEYAGGLKAMRRQYAGPALKDIEEAFHGC